MNVLIAIIRWSAALGGALVAWAALFLYEDEEQRVQRTFERWRDLAAARIALASSRQAAFLSAVTEFTNRAVDRLFGAKLLSARSVNSALTFSLSSEALFLSPLIAAPALPWWYPLSLVGVSLCGLAGVAVLRQFVRRSPVATHICWLLLSLGILASIAYVVPRSLPVARRTIIWATLVGAGCNVFLVIVVRAQMRCWESDFHFGSF